MRREEIIEIIKTNVSDVDFIKDNIRISIERVFSDVSIVRIYINENHIFGFSFDDLTIYEHDEIIYFCRLGNKFFSWHTKGFKFVPKEI